MSGTGHRCCAPASSVAASGLASQKTVPMNAMAAVLRSDIVGRAHCKTLRPRGWKRKGGTPRPFRWVVVFDRVTGRVHGTFTHASHGAPDHAGALRGGERLVAELKGRLGA